MLRNLSKQGALSTQQTKETPLELGSSLTTIAWRQFRKHPMARVTLVVLGFLYFLAAFADFIAPYSERYLDASATFQPPNRIHLINEAGGVTWPFIYEIKKELDMQSFETIWTEDKRKTYPLAFFVRRDQPRDLYVPFPINLIPEPLRQSTGIKPWANMHLFGVRDSTDKVKLYLWGSDDLGGDVFGKILFGARISLTIGILAALVSTILGMLMGGLAGYYGGAIDEIIMRFVEALSAIPSLFLLLTLSAVFYPLNLPSGVVFPLIIVALSLIGWGGIARAIRGQILSLKERDFVQAAKALGANDLRIITKHLLPQTLSFVIVNSSLTIPGFIVTEAVLSFFGLGIQPPATSWGLMLNTAQAFAGVTGLTERWWIFLPGLFIFISVLAWNLLGDGLRDAFDPRSRK